MDHHTYPISYSKYTEQKEKWPHMGNHILAQYNDEAVLVYQAFSPSIARYALENKHFGGDDYSVSRMTWIKTNFLWMMFRSDWGVRKNQECTLGIWIKRESFDRYLLHAVHSSYVPEVYGSKHNYDIENAKKDRGEEFIRLQWDPDHHPNGTPHPHRRAIQLGLKNVRGLVSGEDIVDIVDFSPFVASQRLSILEKVRNKVGPELIYKDLITPSEEVYVPYNPEIAKRLNLNM